MDVHFGQPMILRAIEAGTPLCVNRQFAERVGFSSAELEQRPFLEWIHPDDRDVLEGALLAGAGRAGARHETRLGSWIPFRWEVKSNANGTVALGVLHDRLGDTWDDVVADAPTDAATLNDLLTAMARIVEAKNPGMRCSILLVDGRGEIIRGGAGPSLPDAYNEAIVGLRIGPMVGSCGASAYWNVPVVVENIAEDPLWAELRDAAALAGVAACWSHPVCDTRGKVLGAMALYDDRPRAPTRAQMDGLEIAARMVGLAIEHNCLDDQIHQPAN